jgi:glycosyltransferase involved in cell wall biosynthesis
MALTHLASGLANYGYRQRVYCLNNLADPGIVRSLRSSGAEVRVLSKAQFVALIGLVRLFLEFRSWRPSVVQTFLTYGDMIGRTIARLANVPVVVSSIRARNLDKRWWQFLSDRITIRWVDRVVFNSRQVIPFALANEGVGPEQVVYIPNGVHVGDLRDEPNATPRTRSGLSLPPTARVVGTVGRLDPQKGHRFLLAAFSRVLSNAPDAVLLVIGDGPLRGKLQAEAKELGLSDRVRFLGQRGDVPALLSCMDVYVQASLWEGMPNAVMEAMAAARPVVATAVDGAKELITDGETGWLVEPSDATAMAERIAHALEDVKEAESVGAAAARRMARDFTVQQMVLAYDKLYRELLAAKTHRD